MIGLLPWLGLAGATDLAVRGVEVRPVAGPPIREGVVLIDDGRITAVGPANEVRIPEGVPVLEGAVVTPGLVDALGTVGLTGILNQPPDQDHRETVRPALPALRALDGLDPWEPLLGWVREHGTTTVQVAPSPGPVVAGQPVIVRTLPHPDGAAVRAGLDAMLFTLGDAPKGLFADAGAASRMGAAAIVRQSLAEAREYAARRRLPPADRPAVDLGLEALAEVLGGRRIAIVHAHRADDLLTALRIAREFDLRLVLAGAAEGWLVADVIARAGVPVIVGPVMLRGGTSGEATNTSFENAARLVDAGVRVGLMTGYEGYVPKVRVLLFEAAVAAAHGLGAERALRAVTLDAATILGLGREIGSLEVGKRADLVVFDGDPFEPMSHVCGVVVDGVVVSERCR